jgi:hypothetical protein
VALVSPLTALEGLGAAAGLAVLVAVVRRQPTLGVAVLFLGFLVSGYAFPVARPPHIAVGPVSLYATDLAVIVVALALLAPASGRGSLREIPLPLWLLVVLLAVHTARGLNDHGFQVALNAARPWWWFAVSAFYASTVAWDRALVNVLRWATVVILGIAGYGLLKYGISSSAQLRSVNGELLTLRALTAAGALTLLQLALVLAHVPLRFKVLLLLVAATTLVVVQQRTVWLAAAPAAAILMLQWLRSESRQRPERAYAVVGIAFLLLPLIATVILRSHSIAASLSTAAGPNSTLQWRISSWGSSLHLLHGSAWLVGLSAGSSLTRFVLGTTTTVGPHSLFVDAIVRFGLLGPAVVVAIWVSTMRRLRRARHLPWPIWVGYSLVLSDAIFSVSYGPGLGEGMTLGLLLAAAPAVVPRAASYRIRQPSSLANPA